MLSEDFYQNALVLCGTGHRPNKLYNLYDPGLYSRAVRWLAGYLIMIHKATAKKLVVISGMALGFDMVIALAAILAREMGYPVYLVCAVPCPGQTSKWRNKNTIRWYNDIISKANWVETVVPDAKTDAECIAAMDTRNRWMVNRSEMVIECWNGSPGGTKNCRDYAVGMGRPIVNVFPQIIELLRPLTA